VSAWVHLVGGPCGGQRLRARGLDNGWRGPTREVWACQPTPSTASLPGPWYRYVVTPHSADVYAYAGASRRGW